MDASRRCVFCEGPIRIYQIGSTPALYRTKCRICGEYISDDFNDEGFKRMPKEVRAMISAYIRELFMYSSPVPEMHTLDNENQIDKIVERYANKTLMEKLDNLILFIGKKSNYFGEPLLINRQLDYPITYSKNIDEFENMLGYAIKSGLLSTPELEDAGNIEMTWDGWNRYYEIKRRGVVSNRCFVAISCKEEFRPIYENGIKKAIEETGYQPIFIEQEEHNDKICDLIIAEIRASKFVVADVTGQRQNVYYEAGFAQGLNRDVIWTCNSNEIDRVHFDTRQYNHIVWENEEDLRKKLINRIRATII
jgi:hypothetical protein